MRVPMNILFVTAELAPLVKVGGLADVAGSLPPALRRLGLDVRIALPFYPAIPRESLALQRIASLPGDGALWETEVRDVPVYLIEDRALNQRDVYGGDDEADRFLAFCDGVLSSSERLGWQPDVLHLNDWHPGFIPARLAAPPEHPWATLAQVLTIHNLGFRGLFDRHFATRHGLSTETLAAPEGLPEELPYSALTQGILRADVITTVSPTYAREIQTPEPALGADLAPLFQRSSERLVGILNGIDVEEYDPATDANMAAAFDAGRLDRRIKNKSALQRRLGLPVDDGVPLLGMVSRLFWQKGPDIAVEGIGHLLRNHQVQVAVLGQGAEEYEHQLETLAARHPGRVAVRIAFDYPLGQLIYGGCDMFLMPSRYEPCGLGQMIAMRYGAVPVVRRTGGLADSVERFDRERGTGFLFDEATAESFTEALQSALAVYGDPPAWRRLQLNGMGQDFSWSRAAGEYADVYRKAVRVRAKAGAGGDGR